MGLQDEACLAFFLERHKGLQPALLEDGIYMLTGVYAKVELDHVNCGSPEAAQTHAQITTVSASGNPSEEAPIRISPTAPSDELTMSIHSP